MQIFIGSDHAAFEYKKTLIEHITKQGIKVTDAGTNSLQSCDYNDFANVVCENTLKNPQSLGIVVCGSGIGISMAANKVKGIYCGQVHDYCSAKEAKEIGCNVISIGARIVGIEIAKQIVTTFIGTKGGMISQDILEVEQMNYNK